jgi:hypothetical protein
MDSNFSKEWNNSNDDEKNHIFIKKWKNCNNEQSMKYLFYLLLDTFKLDEGIATKIDWKRLHVMQNSLIVTDLLKIFKDLESSPNELGFMYINLKMQYGCYGMCNACIA